MVQSDFLTNNLLASHVSLSRPKFQFGVLALTFPTPSLVLCRCVRQTTPRLFVKVSSRGLAPEHSGLKAELESDAVSGRWWLKMAITNSVPLPALRKIVGLFRRRGVDVERLLLDVVPMEDPLASSAAAPSSSQASPGLTSRGGLEEGQRQTVTMARALVRINKDAVADSLAGGLSVDAVNAEANSSVSSPCTDDPKFDEAAFFQDLARDVKRLKWLDDSTLDLAYRSLGSAVGGESKEKMKNPRQLTSRCMLRIACTEESIFCLLTAFVF